jgi:hypothetical protein
MPRFKADGFFAASSRISHAALASRHALDVPQVTAKDKVMGVFTATARNLFVCLSFFLFLVCLTVPLQPVLAQGPPVLVQSQKPTVSYDEKKRQANDIAVTVMVSGISCTCARFAEDIRNVVNDLGPDGVRVLPVLGVGGLQNVNDVLFLKNMDMAVVDEDNLRLLKKRIRCSMPMSSSAFNISRSSTIPSFMFSRETKSSLMTI